MQNDACLNRDEASMLDYVRKRRDFPRLAKFSVCPPLCVVQSFGSTWRRKKKDMGERKKGRKGRV